MAVWTTGTRRDEVEVKVGGTSHVYHVDDLSVETIKDLARDAGYSKFVVTVNGEEVAPTEFRPRGGDVVEVRPYDTWA